MITIPSVSPQPVYRDSLIRCAHFTADVRRAGMEHVTLLERGDIPSYTGTSFTPGGSIPVVKTLSRLLQVPVVLMGFCLSDANVHGPNEFFSLNNFDKGL